MDRLIHFNSPVELPKVSPDELASSEPLVKNALVLVEGNHRDNKNRDHSFDRQFIEDVVRNTNQAFRSGKRIGIFTDHKKDMANMVGDLNGELEAKIITEKDLPDKRHTHLIGKLGVFAKDILIKSKDAIEKVASGIASTISPGVSLSDRQIAEISLTGTPAIMGMSLFSRELPSSYIYAEYVGDSTANFSDTALTWEQLTEEKADMEEFKEQFNELGEMFCKLVSNIMKANPQDLQQMQVTQEELVTQALMQYVMQLQELIGITEEEEMPPEANAKNLEMLPDGSQGIRSAQPGVYGGYGGQFSKYPAFSLLDTAIQLNYNPELVEEIAEFYAGTLPGKKKQLV